MAATFPSLAAWGEVLTERADVTVERTDDNITFSVPAAVVEIEVMKGKNGEPIRVENLTGVDNYTQYRSVRNSHAHDRDGFEYSGTNGFTGTVKAEGSTD